MKALVCREFAGIEALKVEEIETPKPGPGQVRIRVRAAALNFPDKLIVEGRYQVKPPLPFVPGMELAGDVVELGEAVDGFAPGDRVAAVVTWGALAQEAVVDADRVVHLPDALSYERGAAFPLTYMTAWHGLVTRGGLKPAEKVVILGAAGGVGMAAIDICRHIGAHAIACARGEEKLAFCSRMGAAETIDYATQDLRAELKARFGREGVDMVLDMVGGDLAEPAFRSLGHDGRHLVVGFAQGDIPRLPMNLALLNERRLIGVLWSDHASRNPGARQALGAKLAALIKEGALSPHIDETGALEETVRLLQTFRDRKVVGKQVVVLP